MCTGLNNLNRAAILHGGRDRSRFGQLMKHVLVGRHGLPGEAGQLGNAGLQQRLTLLVQSPAGGSDLGFGGLRLEGRGSLRGQALPLDEG